MKLLVCVIVNFKYKRGSNSICSCQSYIFMFYPLTCGNVVKLRNFDQRCKIKRLKILLSMIFIETDLGH